MPVQNLDNKRNFDQFKKKKKGACGHKDPAKLFKFATVAECEL